MKSENHNSKSSQKQEAIAAKDPQLENKVLEL